MHSSLSSTVCSTPTNDSVEKVIKNDTVRYQRKGYGLISAFLLTIGFFYFVPKIFEQIWPKLVANFSHEYLFAMLAIGIHTGSHVVSNVVMYVVYKLKLPFFERYKIMEKQWPWESDPEAWNQQLKKTFKVLALAHFVIVPVVVFIEIMTGGMMRMDMESFPTVKEITTQVVFFMFCEDFFFYWGHRLLHHKKLYPYIHKVHHEYSTTVSIAAEYAHPIEFILSNIIPTNSGPKILGSRVHMVTYCIWLIIRIMETADGHCGYEFSWSPYRLLPLSGSSNYHNFHHSQNIGNFSSFFTFWDTLCGTNRIYFKHLAQKEKKKVSAMIQHEYNQMTERLNNNPDTKLAKQLEKKIEKIEEVSTKLS